MHFLLKQSQLVENEELIGTLIDTNERIIAALDMYDTVCDLLSKAKPSSHFRVAPEDRARSG